MTNAVQTEPKIKINIPEYLKKTSEDVWEELEIYIFHGFLTSPATIAGQQFVFKTLNHHEFDNISYLKPSNVSPIETQIHYKATFIAHSIFMINGENVLNERPRNIRKLTKIVSKLPSSFHAKIIEHLGLINKKASRLYPLVEVYCHENRSRFKWYNNQSSPISSRLNTGIAGTEEIGQNYCQETWIAMNRIIDIRDNSEREWSNAKFIGSCFAGKGVKSIDVQDRAQKDIERQRIEEKKMDVLYRYLKKIDDPDEVLQKKVTLPDGREAEIVGKKHQATSVEDLAGQLQSSLNNEKDFHDLAIEKAFTDAQKRVDAIEEHKRQLYAKAVLEPETSSYVLPGGAAEANARISRMEKLRMEAMRAQQKEISSGDINDKDKGE